MYKRLSARFHVLNETKRISGRKWKQGLAESAKYGMKIEELRLNLEQIRYSGKFNADVSKLKNYASKLCSFGATLIGKGAEIESRFKGKGLDFCIKTFGDEPTWEMLQKFRNCDEFENFLEEAR